jgi:hypothetical protein
LCWEYHIDVVLNSKGNHQQALDYNKNALEIHKNLLILHFPWVCNMTVAATLMSDDGLTNAQLPVSYAQPSGNVTSTPNKTQKSRKVKKML